MNPTHSHRSPLQNVPKKPRVLVQIIFGSVALHLLVLWAAARFPTPLAKAPEITTEVQLSDSPAPAVAASKPQVVPAARPQSPPRISAKPARPEQPRPRPTRREIVPTAPLVRSTREVAKTGTVAKKPVEPRPTAALPAPISPTRRAPDAILPKIGETKSAAKTRPDKIARLPSASKKAQSTKKSGKKQGSGSAKKARTIARANLNDEEPVTPKPTQSDVTSPIGNVIQNRADENGKTRNATGVSNPKNGGNGLQAGEVSSAGNGNDDGGNPGGGTNGSGGGPFGVGDAAGEGPRRIVYILDISYSMEPRLERAKEEINDALGGLQAGESFNIVAFYGNVRPFDEKLVAATPANIAGGRAFVDSLRVGRYTNLELAFEKAFAAPDVNVVVLITDGVPTTGLGSPDFSQTDNFDISANFGELAERVRGLNVAKARIYTVGIVGKNADGTPAKFEASGLLGESQTRSNVTSDISQQPSTFVL